jgi:hypothetical protein
MAQPVKLSDPLINAARKSATSSHRSLAAQVEHWATLGCAIEGALTADQTASLKGQVREPGTAEYRNPSKVSPAALAKAIGAALSSSGQHK